MINLTLTITAAPELLAAMSKFTNSITSAKVVTIPKADSDFTPRKVLSEKTPNGDTYIQPAQPVKSNSAQNSTAQITITEQPIQTQTPISVNPTYNQANIGSVNTGNTQGALGAAYPMQAPQQAPVVAPIAQAPTIPTSAQVYTMEQLAVAATQLVDAGRRTELVGLLSSFGVQALTALPKEQYGTFATQLRALGAKI